MFDQKRIVEAGVQVGSTTILKLTSSTVKTYLVEQGQIEPKPTSSTVKTYSEQSRAESD